MGVIIWKGFILRIVFIVGHAGLIGLLLATPNLEGRLADDSLTGGSFTG